MLNFNDELDIDNVVSNIKYDMHKSYNGILLTDSEISILKQYGFNINNYNNVGSLIFDLENYLNEEDGIEELEQVLESISEFNYYHNTNK